MKILLFANTDWYLFNFRLPLIRTLHERGVEVVLLSPPGEYGERLQEKGYRWIPFNLARAGMNPFRELFTILQLVQVYQREKPDVVHHFTVKCVLYGSIAARLARIKAIVNAVTGLGYIFMQGNLVKKLFQAFVLAFYRLALRGTQVIFQNRDDRAAFLQAWLVHPERIHLIPSSGVDLQVFRLTPEPSQVDPIVMLAARMLWDKGIAEFVEAAQMLKNKGVAARFVLVGKPYLDNPASVSQEQLEAWQQSGIVEWWGWRDDMPAVLAQASIVCLPSYREGLPKTLIEASALGRVVVTTDVPGCRDAVIPEQTGLLVPVKNAPALAAALETLLSNSELRAQMGQAGHFFAVKTFSSENVVAHTLDVYARAGMPV
jgi:glycosyltransferase involved in cell wall biosynthesis